MPQTHVAIVSGRALKEPRRLDQRQRERPPGGLSWERVRGRLCGSHASWCGRSPASTEDGARVDCRQAPGAIVEEKPTALAFHYRKADDQSAAAALERIFDGPARWDGVYVRHGKKVVELSVVDTNKGAALQRIRQRLGARCVLYLGDDVTV